MFNWTANTLYWLLFSQVIITLLIVPYIVRTNFTEFAKKYGGTQYPNAKDAIDGFLKKNMFLFNIVVFTLFIFAFCIVSYAAINQDALFNWDNQIGAAVLFLLAALPIIIMGGIQNRFFSILSNFSEGKRNATLKARGVWDFISAPMIILIVSGHLSVIGTVIYFGIYPFSGFAGYTNLLALVFLDFVFIISIYFIMNNKRLAMIKDPNQRVLILQNAINFNVIIWGFALFYLCLSLWVSGLALPAYKFYAQSVYFHSLFLMMAFMSKMPKTFC